MRVMEAVTLGRRANAQNVSYVSFTSITHINTQMIHQLVSLRTDAVNKFSELVLHYMVHNIII